MVEERTQIKFETPDIDGSLRPQLINLEEEKPIEGTTEKDDGTTYTWHKWLCTDDKYFMASPSLDGMLKLLPNKVGRILKIEKVLNPKGNGYPYFQIDGMHKDEIVAHANIANANNGAPEQEIFTPPPISSPQPGQIEKKLDHIITLISELPALINKDKMPF